VRLDSHNAAGNVPARRFQRQFSHLDATGAARMVDVGHKPAQRRVARAEGYPLPTRDVAALRERALPKGDVLTVAKIAAIRRETPDDLIPLCHSLPVDAVESSLPWKTRCGCAQCFHHGEPASKWKRSPP
jgi:molybdenum cofactor biosynthesis enzyme